MVLWLHKVLICLRWRLPEDFYNSEILEVRSSGGQCHFKRKPTLRHLIAAQSGITEGLLQLLTGSDPIGGGVHRQTTNSLLLSHLSGEGGDLFPHVLVVGGHTTLQREELIEHIVKLFREIGVGSHLSAAAGSLVFSFDLAGTEGRLG